MQNKKTIIFVVVGIIVLAGVFYGGMLYGKSQTSALINNRFSANMQNRGGQLSVNNGTNNRMNDGGFINGEIISKDDKSMTVKLMNGGSKIIFFDTSTTVSKMSGGTLSDLVVGTQIGATGAANSDGSITAKTIQIRPQIK